MKITENWGKGEHGEDLYIDFGKNGQGITNEIIAIGKRIEELSKDYSIYLHHESFIDTADDVYTLKFQLVKKTMSETNSNFEDSTPEAESEAVKQILEKSLHNTTANGAKQNVKDIQFWGDGDTFLLISKASSESEGWMKSTKAMPAGTSVVVQVTTQQRNPDGSYSVAEALTTVENAIIYELIGSDGKAEYRAIVQRKDDGEMRTIKASNGYFESSEL
jgi:hypothetical protein